MTAPQPCSDALTRPGGACVLCKPPLGARSWVRAYSGHRTCEHCQDKLTRTLGEIADRYEKLNPRPGAQGDIGGRGSPGFGSRSPASDHVIAIRDARSSDVARVWVGGDGRVHKESERAPLSVYTTLLTEVFDVAERRSMSLPDPCLRVRHLTEWLKRHVEWLTRQENVVEFRDVLKALTRQLKPLTGDKPKKPFGHCPNTIDDGDHSHECGGPLFPPPVTYGTIKCDKCGRKWRRGEDPDEHGHDEWDRLGKLIKNRV